MKRKQFLSICGLAGLVPNWAGYFPNHGRMTRETVPGNTRPRIDFEKIRLELFHTWSISRGSSNAKENVLVYYSCQGKTGVGEAAHLTAAGQDAERTISELKQLIPLYEKTDPWYYYDLPARAAAIVSHPAPAKAALDIAQLDWVGKMLGIPLFRLFGIDPRCQTPTSFSIGLDRPEVIAGKVAEAEPYRVLKVKLGRADDEEIVRRLRQVSAKPLRVDANEGWSDKQTALRKIEWLAGQGVELVEQPLPRHMIEESRWLKERSPLPVIADESCQTARDIPRMAGAFHGINIKLMKAGGIQEALRMFGLARMMALDTMLGCMIESSVGISAAVQLQPLARWLDLDGSLLIRNDPFRGADFRNGGWLAPAGPGIGVEKR